MRAPEKNNRAEKLLDTKRRITKLQGRLVIWQSKQPLYRDQPEKLQFIDQQIQSTTAELQRLQKTAQH